MGVVSPESTDKIIVDRRKRRPRNNAWHTVHTAREHLGKSTGLTPKFASELLKNHASAQLHGKMVFLAMVLLIGIVEFRWLGPHLFAIWGLLALAAYGGLMILCRNYLDGPRERSGNQKWTRRFLLVQFGIGLLWAAFFAARPFEALELKQQVIQFSALLVLMAANTLMAYNLRLGASLASLPALFVLLVRFAQTFDMAALAMAAMLVSAGVFFEILAQRLNAHTLSSLRSAAEKDQLIVELEMATAMSDEARRRAEEANLAKSRFLATMSHELRTPLNAILGFSEVISSEVMGPLSNAYYKDYVRDIHASGTHLLNLINEILDLSRVEAGRFELNETPVSLGTVVEEACQMVKMNAAAKNIEIIVRIHPKLPDIMADARAVRQVALNLLSNAIKFTPAGGTIWLKAGWTANGGQYLSVRDSGPGIPEDEIPIVLSSFGQGSIAIKSAEQGTGLGLPIVQAFMHMHEGKFDLKSKLREGTEAVATFPKHRVLLGSQGNDEARPAAKKRVVSFGS